MKLADFGLARMFGHPEDGRFTAQVFTRWYRPPELLFGSSCYGPAVDMWAAGCVFAGGAGIVSLAVMIIAAPFPQRSAAFLTTLVGEAMELSGTSASTISFHHTLIARLQFSINQKKPGTLSLDLDTTAKSERYEVPDRYSIRKCVCACRAAAAESVVSRRQ